MGQPIEPEKDMEGAADLIEEFWMKPEVCAGLWLTSAASHGTLGWSDSCSSQELVRRFNEQMHAAMPVRSASGLRGVTKNSKNTYIAMFRKQYLGAFTSTQLAAMAYDKAARAAG